MAKKKKIVNSDAVYKNGMHVERTNQALIQGAMMLAYMCLLGVFAYIVSMIPAGIFGVFIANGSTTNQVIYDIQNITLALIGIVICAIGGNIFAKKVGENDAETAFRYNQPRTLDKKYLFISIAIGVAAYIFIGVVLNVDFFVGPVRYLGIILTRAERSINEGIKVGIGYRAIAMLICMVIEIPFMLKGVAAGFNEKMELLCDTEEEENRKKAERAEAEANFNARRNKNS